MGSIHYTRIPFILVITNQSHLSPLSKSYSFNPLIDPKTHFGTGTAELFFVMNFHDLPCLPTYVLCLAIFLCHDHVLSRLHLAIMTILLTVSTTLVPLLTHSLLLSIFS